MLAALGTSFCILFWLNNFTVRNFATCFVLIFLAMDLTRRFAQAHHTAGIDLEAAQLYSHYCNLH